MFEIVYQSLASDKANAYEIRGIPAPPAGYVAPLGASPYTWPNIYRNLKNIDYCVDQFNDLSNRIKCINAYAGGPFLD